MSTAEDQRLIEARALPILEVAARLGIEGLRRDGREHVGPCPVCGGKDRFSIAPDRGVFNCRICARGGDGLALVQHLRGCDFKSALNFLAGEVSAVDAETLARRRQRAQAADMARARIAAQARARAIRDAREIWHSALPAAGTLADDYLRGRGLCLDPWPPTLRYLPDHPYRRQIGGRNLQLHRGPALIAAIQDASGRVRGIHQTWIDPARPGGKAEIVGPDGRQMPAKMVRGSKKGGAIRLTPVSATGILIVGEGIETTASALISGVRPCAAFWAGVDLGNMAGRMERQAGTRWSGRPDLGDAEAWIPPAGTVQLYFLQDGDSDPKATRAKLECGLRRAAHARPGLQGLIVPAPAGADFNDILTAEIKNEGADDAGD